MHFLQTPLVAATIALVPTIWAQGGLQGQGAIQVTTPDGDLPLGCIDSSGQWTVANECAGFGTAGSQLFTGNSWLSVNGDGEIVVVEDWESSASWQATAYSFGGNPAYLVAIGGGDDDDDDNDDDDVEGGPFWYAPAVPTADEAVVLSATASKGDQNVTLTWYQLSG